MDERQKQYPSNSYSKVAPRNSEKPPEKKVEPIATGRVVQRKKSLGEKFAETFLASDLRSVARHVVFDVLIPEIKNMLSDMIHGSTDIMLFGDRRSGRYNRDRGGGTVVRTDYGSRFNERNGRPTDRDERQPIRPNPRTIVEEFAFRTRIKAEEVLDCMVDRIEEFHVLTVKDYYTIADQRTDNYTLDKWGWFELTRDIPIEQVPEGFVIRLPKPQIID